MFWCSMASCMHLTNWHALQEDDDDGEEDDDDEGRGRASKRRRRGAGAQFIDEMAAVDDEDEEEEAEVRVVWNTGCYKAAVSSDIACACLKQLCLPAQGVRAAWHALFGGAVHAGWLKALAVCSAQGCVSLCAACTCCWL